MAVAAVQVLLVAVAPPRGLLAGSGQQGSGDVSAAGNAGGAGASTTGGASPGGGATTTGGAIGTGGASTTGVGGGSSSALGSVAGAGPNTTVAAAADLSKCDPKTGKEIGPLTDSPKTNFIMPNCLPVFHGTNGGATMTGVTATTISYVTFQIQGNAEFNAALGAGGLQSSPEQWCEAQQAFRDEIQKRWELFGRKLVSLDGPAGNAGSGQQSPCHFPYFQSQCNPAPADESCYRAEADVIAAMHPAMVLSTTLDPALFDQLTNRDHVIAFTTASTPFPLASYQQSAPYFYSAFMDGNRLATFDAEYWCKKLSNKPAIHAGVDVRTTRNWGPTPGVTPIRKVGVVYPEDSENVNKQNVDLFAKLVSGGPGSMCNSPGGVLEVPLSPNPSQIAEETNTATNAMIQDHITDVVLWTDPILGPESFTNTAQADNYTLADSDVTKAWQDAGNSGTPAPDQGLYLWPYMFMGDAFMEAGSSPTVVGIHQALLNMGNNGGWAKLHDPAVAEWGLGQSSPWTFAGDVREVYWSPTRTAEDNGKTGSYCPVAGGLRYNPGQFTTDDSGLFATPGC